MVLLEREHVRVMAGLRVGHESQDKAESATELPGSLRADRECTMSYLGHRQWSPTLAGGQEQVTGYVQEPLALHH